MTQAQAEKLNETDKLEGMIDISNEDYHKGPGISSSNLIDLLEYSPLHMKYYKENPTEPTPAMLYGSRVHTAVLEPELFEKEYVIKQKFDKRVKGNAEKEEEWLAANVGRIGITQSDYDDTMRIRDVLLADPRIKAILDGALIEKAFYWTDPDTGVLCKARPDILSYDLGMIVDLKTIDNCAEWNIKTRIRYSKYYLQNMFHMDGVNIVGEKLKLNPIKDGCFLFVEKEEPHGFKLRAITLDDLQVGFDEYKKALAIYAECVKTGVFPGYENKINEIRIFER